MAGTSCTHSKKRVMKRMALAVLFFQTLGPGCGAEGKKSPEVPAPYTDHEQCPTVEASLVETRQALQDAQWEPIRPHIETILVDDGGLRVLLPAALHAFQELDRSLLLDVTEGVEDDRGVARLSVHLKNILDYIIGTSTHVAGEHYGTPDVFHLILQNYGRHCNVVESAGALKRILELEVDGVPWIEPTFDVLLELTADPEFQSFLEDVEFDEETETGEISVGRDAFILIMKLLTANLAEDNFDLDYFRGLLEDFFLLQFSPESQTHVKLNELISYLEMLMDPESEIFPYAQSFVKCVNDVDEEGEIPGMIYDYLSIEELSFIDFLQDIDTMGDEPAGQALRPLMISTIEILEEDPQTLIDVMWTMARFLDPEVSRNVFPALASLQGTGAFGELVTLYRFLIEQCSVDGDRD